MKQTFRGVVAGTGAFSALGRQVAFASSAFLGAAGASAIITKSIGEAQEAAKVQAQLSAQFRAAGVDLRLYQAQIDSTSTRLSRLAGIQDEELTQSFITAFRGTKDVAVGLRIEGIAADVAKARNISLQAATIALTKAYAGQATALRRLGIQVPKNVEGMQLLNAVGRQFAGQAAANTNAFDRLRVALSETEELIGTALLPVVEEYADRLTTWLTDTHNQERIQRDVEEAIRITATAIDVLAEAMRTAKEIAEPFYDVMKKLTDLPGGKTGLLDLPGGRKGLLEILGLRGGGGEKDLRPSSVPFSPARLGEREGIATADAGRGGRRGAGRTSLQGQLNLLETRLAQALTTIGKADDRALLVQEKHLLGRMISDTKDWQKRRDLYEKLARVQDQIAAIDQDKADAAEAAARAEKERRDKRLAALRKEREAAREHTRKIREAAKEAREALRDAIGEVRSQVGELFQGPILNPSQDATKRILGVRGPTAGNLIRDVRAQTAQFLAFNNDLARLSRRGAPAGLISELRAGGVAGAANVHALAVASKGTLAQLFKAFAQREKLVQQIARADIQARTVTVVAGSLNVTRTAPTTQRRGRTAGLPIASPGHVIS